jgi:hypothetical protein
VNNGSWPCVYDWRADVGIATEGARVFFVVPVSGAESDEVLGEAKAAERKTNVEKLLRTLSGAEQVHIAQLDGGVGASCEAIGALLGFASSVVTLTMAAEFYAPRIRNIVGHLSDIFGCRDCTPSIALSPEALQILVVDDIRARFGLNPTDIRSANCISHASPPMERRIELEQMYACHNITVDAVRDNFLHVWSYIVSSDGYVITEALTKVPIPNGSRWSDIEPRGRRLIA